MLRSTAVLAALLAPLLSACPAHSSEAPAPPASLRLASAAPWVFSGKIGGPFTPARATITLAASFGSVKWQARSTAKWLRLSDADGSLAGGQQKALTAMLDEKQAQELAPGVHQAQVVVSDAATPETAQRVFVLLDVRSSDWTEFKASSDTRTVYVSSSQGNDANDGLSKARPKRTLAAGKAQMRHGHPDWLLLRCGDTWDEALGQWKASGRSAKEPMLIGSFGEGERPFLRTGSDNGIWTSNGGDSPARIEHLAIVGLHMTPHTYQGGGEPAGISFLVGSTDVLVEDCLIERYQTNIVMQGYFGRHADFRLRRSVIVDAFATGNATSGHGLYLSNTDGVLIEENLFDHNGWNETIPDAKATIFRHDVYVQSGSGTCSDVVARRNVFANAASHGLQMRPGGVVLENVFARNSIALLLGGGNEPNPGGVTACALGNVILDGKDIDAENKRGWGIELSNIAAGVVADNIIANRTSGGFPIPIDVHGTNKGAGVFDCALVNNVVWNWGGSLLVQGDERQLRGILLEGNLIHADRGNAPLVSFPARLPAGVVRSESNEFEHEKAPAGAWFSVGDAPRSLDAWRELTNDRGSKSTTTKLANPQRTLASYMSDTPALGGNLDAFFAQRRKQSRQHWRAELESAPILEYLRQGFAQKP